MSLSVEILHWIFILSVGTHLYFLSVVWGGRKQPLDLTKVNVMHTFYPQISLVGLSMCILFCPFIQRMFDRENQQQTTYSQIPHVEFEEATQILYLPREGKKIKRFSAQVQQIKIVQGEQTRSNMNNNK